MEKKEIIILIDELRCVIKEFQKNPDEEKFHLINILTKQLVNK
jgi:hypothetical protein